MWKLRRNIANIFIIYLFCAMEVIIRLVESDLINDI